MASSKVATVRRRVIILLRPDDHHQEHQYEYPPNNLWSYESYNPIQLGWEMQLSLSFFWVAGGDDLGYIIYILYIL